MTVRDLRATTAGGTVLLDGVGFTLDAGRVLAVVGPSGAGKSTLGLALLGEAGPGIGLAGSVRAGDTELLGPGPAAPHRAGAGRVGYLPQHPGVVLDPVRRCGPVLDELAAIGHGSGRRSAPARAAAAGRALERAGLAGGPQLGRRFPHQLSGGQQQRMALAQTLVTDPAVVVLDEPTTGLDPVTTGIVVDRLAALTAAGTALVLLTHDLDVARRLADEVLELDAGRPGRHGTPAALLGPGRAPVAPGPAAGGDPALEVTGLSVRAPDGALLLSGVDLAVARGGCAGVAGPSGAGKTTLGRALAGLTPSSGSVLVHGTPPGPDRRAVQYVHQDARSAFLDHRPVLDQVARPAVRLRGLPVADAVAVATALLDRLGLGADVVRRRPGGLSGGQLQRASVARALLAGPRVLVADEPTSALDARHRDLLLAELDRERDARGTAVVLISHDPAVLARTDGVLTLTDGRAAALTPRRARAAVPPSPG
ncbi:hypothetical protein AFB00_13890 [Pseudonocardia sp. HH130630-07]|nr:hypothetical protein AFB00_13890 [Pseudonocardia sp. HH130630-07]